MFVSICSTVLIFNAIAMIIGILYKFMFNFNHGNISKISSKFQNADKNIGKNIFEEMWLAIKMRLLNENVVEMYDSSKTRSKLAKIDMGSLLLFEKNSNFQKKIKNVLKCQMEKNLSNFPVIRSYKSLKVVKSSDGYKTDSQASRVCLSDIPQWDKKRQMPSYLLLSKKLRELKRNKRENGGILNFDEVRSLSPLSSVIHLERRIFESNLRKGIEYRPLDPIDEI